MRGAGTMLLYGASPHDGGRTRGVVDVNISVQPYQADWLVTVDGVCRGRFASAARALGFARRIKTSA